MTFSTQFLGAGGSCDGSIAGPNKFCEDNFSLEASATADNSVPVCGKA